MAYIPIATDASQPTGDKPVASAAPEFRALKGYTDSLFLSISAFQTQLNTILAGIGAGDNSAALAAALASSGGAALIGMLQPKTGAVYRTIAAKFKEQISVLDFGAIGDGVVDDTVAIQTALNAGGHILFPQGSTFKFSGYIEIFDNTALTIHSDMRPTNRAAGLFSNGRKNIGIYGDKIGNFLDPVVLASYSWNPSTVAAPVIHIRSSENVHVDGLNFSYTRVGVLVSNATVNLSLQNAWVLSQAAPKYVTVSNCRFDMIEGAGACCYSGVYVTFAGNYVGRTGDGGYWMMGALQSKIIDSFRISPKTTAADVTLYGINNPARPTTWNDVQGIEFENCHSCVISGNVVQNFCQLPVDIKNSCSEILADSNVIIDAESGGIVVRAGDSVQNAVMRVTISNNQLFNMGASQTGAPAGPYQGGIYAAESYLVAIKGNVFHGWQLVPCIKATGPGTYLASQYGANPVQAAVNIEANEFWMKSAFQETVPAFSASTTTPPAIVVSGFYDTVKISGVLIKTNRFFATDTTISPYAAIQLNYVAANAIFYPMSALISDVVISNWTGPGIHVTGVPTQLNSGLAMNSIAISGVTGYALNLEGVNGFECTGLNISNVGSGAGTSAVIIQGASALPVIGGILSNCNIYGREVGGSSTMTYGLAIDNGNNITVANVTIRGAVTGNYNITNQAGEIRFTNCTGFPRTQAGTPVGNLAPYFMGEEIFATTLSKWWKSHAALTNTAWTQLSN